MDPAARQRLATTLFVLFCVTMLMGVGPGVLLVNRPGTFLGIPLLYAWGLLWYGVQVGIVVTAYVFLWREPRTDEAEQTPESRPHERS